MSSVTTSHHCPSAVKNSVPFSSFVVWKEARRPSSLQRAPSQQAAGSHACISGVEGSLWGDIELVSMDQNGDAPTARRGENPDCATRNNTPRASESNDAF